MGSKNSKRDDINNLDYVLRVAIGTYDVSKVCGRGKSYAGTLLAKKMGIDQSRISRWIKPATISGEFIVNQKTQDVVYPPSFVEIARLASFLDRTEREMIIEAIECDFESDDKLFVGDVRKKAEQLKKFLEENGSHYDVRDDFEPFQFGDATDADRDVIRKLELARFIGFFITKDKDGLEKTGHLVFETSATLKTGTVQGIMRIVGKAEEPYFCNVVSPINQQNLYIHMRQRRGKYDIGLIVFRVDRDMQGDFLCGSGLMVSTNRDNGHVQLQWVVFIRLVDQSNLIKKRDGRVVTKKHLVVDENTPAAMQILEFIDSNATQINVQDENFEIREEVIVADKLFHEHLTESLMEENSGTNYAINFGILLERQRTVFDYNNTNMLNVELKKAWDETHNNKYIM